MPSPVLNVVELPVRNLNDVPVLARKFADDLAAGEYGDVKTVMVVALADDILHSFAWGEWTRLGGIGLLEAAKLQQVEAFHECGE